MESIVKGIHGVRASNQLIPLQKLKKEHITVVNQMMGIQKKINSAKRSIRQ